MGASEETLALLRRIAVAVEKLAAGAQAAAGGAVASDRDLDGRYGDPELRFNPRDWTGPSYKGRRFSECPPDLLDMVAETFDYFAQKAEEAGEMTEKGKPVAEYKRLDAARARGWSKRIREGKHVQAAAPSEGWNDAAPVDAGWAEAPRDSDIPF